MKASKNYYFGITQGVWMRNGTGSTGFDARSHRHRHGKRALEGPFRSDTERAIIYVFTKFPLRGSLLCGIDNVAVAFGPVQQYEMENEFMAQFTKL